MYMLLRKMNVGVIFLFDVRVFSLTSEHYDVFQPIAFFIDSLLFYIFTVLSKCVI